MSAESEVEIAAMREALEIAYPILAYYGCSPGGQHTNASPSKQSAVRVLEAVRAALAGDAGKALLAKIFFTAGHLTVFRRLLRKDCMAKLKSLHATYTCWANYCPIKGYLADVCGLPWLTHRAIDDMPSLMEPIRVRVTVEPVEGLADLEARFKHIEELGRQLAFADGKAVAALGCCEVTKRTPSPGVMTKAITGLAEQWQKEADEIRSKLESARMSR
jgi:hypothetical protein